MTANVFTTSPGHAAAVGRRRGGRIAGVVLAIALVLAALSAVATGPVAIAPARVFAVLADAFSGAGDPAYARESLVLFSIRLPRIVLAMLIGAALAVSGAMMQGLFRNPLADPGIIGVSSGAALFAATTIVLGDRLLALSAATMQGVVLPAGAFVGGLLTTALLYVAATRGGRTSVVTMLLAGVAIAALAGACTGLLVFMSDDRQLRDLTFWTMGGLGGANWTRVAAAAPAVAALLVAAPFLARGLNALSLGEAAAFHLGYRVQRLKAMCVVLVALAVGVSVAASGVIGFVGIVVPHVLRLAVGPDYTRLLPLSALAGAALLVAADGVARTVVAPAELPIGVLTALGGSPFFLWLLLRRAKDMP